jgi:hypothetical protein
MEIPSTMGEVVPLQKLACSGDAGDILVTHVWNFLGQPLEARAEAAVIQDTSENPLAAQISFLLTNSCMPRSESSLP